MLGLFYMPDLINFILDNASDIESSFVNVLNRNILFFTIKYTDSDKL